MRTAWKAIPTLSRTCAHYCSGLRAFGGGSATSAGCAEIVGIRFRSGLLAGGNRIRTCMGFFLSSSRFGLLPVLCSEREGRSLFFNRAARDKRVFPLSTTLRHHVARGCF